jgi:hypothetical protein
LSPGVPGGHALNCVQRVSQSTSEYWVFAPVQFALMAVQ